MLLIQLVLMTTVRLNPGPGAYEPKNQMNQTGQYLIAGVKNSKAPTFSLPSLKRFSVNDKHKNIPGPG